MKDMRGDSRSLSSLECLTVWAVDEDGIVHDPRGCMQSSSQR